MVCRLFTRLAPTRDAAEHGSEGGQLMSMEPPQKRFKVTLVIEAWDWQDVLHEAESVVDHIREHGPACSSVMGGGSVSHSVRVQVDDVITREQWVSDLNAYLAECKAERESP